MLNQPTAVAVRGRAAEFVRAGGANTNASEHVHAPTNEESSSQLPFEYVELVRPSHDEIQQFAERLGVDDALLEHVQDWQVATGLAQADDAEQFHIRCNVPSLPVDNEIVWDRLDILLGQSFVAVLQPRSLTPVRRGTARFGGRKEQSPADFAAVLLDQVVDVFQLVLLSIERDAHASESRSRSQRREDGTESPDVRGLMGEIGRAGERLTRLFDGLIDEELELISSSARNQFRISRDRLGTIDDDVARMRDRIEARPVPQVSEERENALGAESPEVIETAAQVGARRLRRLNPAHAITALLGAFGVSFGAIAMSWTAGPWLQTLGFERAQWLGAFVFPIGFVIVLVGKGELFTENFLFPITGVIRGRGTIRDLLELWGYVLFFNMVGSAIAAFLMSRTGVLNGPSADFLKQVAVDKVNYSFWDAFMKAIFAGWLMTIMTWLILAATGLGPRLVVIWMTGFLIVAAHFNHVVISAPEIFTAMMLGAPITLGDWFLGNFVPALLGNLIGVVVFVTILGFAQARMLEQSENQNEGNDRSGRNTRFWPEV